MAQQFRYPQAAILTTEPHTNCCTSNIRFLVNKALKTDLVCCCYVRRSIQISSPLLIQLVSHQVILLTLR